MRPCALTPLFIPMHTRLLSVLFASAVVLGALPGQSQRAPIEGIDETANFGSRVGVNMSELAYWGPQLVFVDLFKSCAEWIPQKIVGGAWNTGESFPVRNDGYPASLAADQAVATLLATGMGSRYTGGRYVCLYEGDGDFEFRWDAVAGARSPGRIEVDVTPAQGILLRITRTNPSNPIRNVRFILPGFEATYRTQPFHPSILERWSLCKTIRFMDWQRTNSTYQSAWTDRARPDYYTQQGVDGVAFEYMIDLCNALSADAWFCLPHLSTDGYAREFARLVQRRLRPDLNVYVEYSNECWNSTFVQARYCREMGVAANLSTDPYEAQLRYYSQRTVELHRICAQELPRVRLRRVLAGQNVNTWATGVILDWRNAGREADVWAVNAYFGHALGDPVNQTRVQNMEPLAILVEAALDVVPALAFSAQQLAAAQQRGVTTMVAFEAGQHLVGYGSAAGNWRLSDKLTATNRLPGMRQLYDYFLEEWKRVGGGLCCLYNSTSAYGLSGSWGMFEDSQQPLTASPKFMGTLDFTLRHRYR